MDLKKRQFPIPDGKTTDISELYHPSEEGLKFIMDEEGYRPSPYDDLTKKPLSLEDIRNKNYKGNPTIGYGHKLTENELRTGKLQGRDIYAGIDEPTARKMVSKEDALKDTRAVLLKALKGEERVKMTPEQLDALYSFGYNVGPGVLEKEVLPLRGNQDEMIKQMQKYNKSKGQELPGLIERRKIEGEMMKGRKYQQGGMPTPEELNQLGEEEAMSQPLPQRQPASVETPTELQPQPDMLNQMMREYQDLRKGEADQLAKLQEKKKTSDWLSALSGIASIGGQVAPNRVDIKPIDFSQNVNQEIEGIGAKRKANLAELAQMYDLYAKMKPKTNTAEDELKKAQAAKIYAELKSPKKDPIVERERMKQAKENQDTLKSSSKNMSTIDETIEMFKKYSKSNVGGTGGLAYAKSFLGPLDTETQALNKQFNKLNIDSLLSTAKQVGAKGMDSDAEKKLFLGGQPTLGTDDKANLQILLGAKALELKQQQLAKEKDEFLKAGGDPIEFSSPIQDGDVTAVINSKGQMELVNKVDLEKATQQGFMPIDAYVDRFNFNKSDIKSKQSNKELGTSVLLQAPDGTTKRVKKEAAQKYLDMGAKIIGE